MNFEKTYNQIKTLRQSIEYTESNIQLITVEFCKNYNFEIGKTFIKYPNISKQNTEIIKFLKLEKLAGIEYIVITTDKDTYLYDFNLKKIVEY
jgi:hypothetical protein